MTSSLPSAPTLESLKKQAKALLKQHRQGDASCCGRLRRLRRFRGASEERILEAQVKLSDAQFAVALDYGFQSWTALKEFVAGVQSPIVPGLDALFEEHREILESSNISGAKVLFLLVQTAGLRDTTWGEVHAADGLGLAFCYIPRQYAAVYTSNMGLPQRAGPLLGCRMEWTLSADPEAAWAFIEAALAAGSPAKMPGPEDSIIDACGSAGQVEDRFVHARSVGGPAMNGRVGWEEFAAWIPRWNPPGGGGIYRVAGTVDKPPLEDAVRTVARRVIDWQDHHPALQWRFGSASNYGITAFERYIADLLDADVEMPAEYIDCIAINFQLNARAALSDHFREVGGKLSGRTAAIVQDVAANYRTAADGMGKFAMEGLGNSRDTREGREAIAATLGVALEAEKRVYAGMEKLSAG